MTAPVFASSDAEASQDVLLGTADLGLRALSVAEVQQALRELRAREPRLAQRDTGSHRTPDDTSRPAPRHRAAPPRRNRAAQERRTREHGRGDTAPERGRPWGDVFPSDDETRGEGSNRRTGWITVRAAHAGAGASTVALAISDAAAESGRPAHLIEDVRPSRSGLLSAASAELGVDAAGIWRRGLRSNVTIDRRATEATPGGWPVLTAGDAPGVTVVDLGLGEDSRACLSADRTFTVVVCRPTVPGVRLTEQLLDQLAQQPVVVAAIGTHRWPGEVTATVGPRLRELRDAGHVVTVPMDRRLAITGLTSCPLPKPVHAAGRALLERLDAIRPEAAPSSTATTRPLPARERARR